MTNFRIKASLFLNYFVFAILLNSVGTVIFQIQRNFDLDKKTASTLEGFKDLSIAIASFLIASYVVRIGYKRTMLIGLALVSIVCMLMPSMPSFMMTKILFATVGISFALIKVTVFSTIGLVTGSQKEHLSFMNFLESFFMVGVMTQSFLFAAFVNNDDASSTQWFNVYYVLAGISVLAFLLLLTTRLDESSVRKPDRSGSPATDFVGMLSLIVIPLVLVFIFCAFFSVLIEQSIMSWLPTFNNEVMHLSASLSIQMAAILSASIAAGRFLAGILLRKFSWIVVLVACIIGAGMLVMITVPLTKGLQIASINRLSDVPLIAYAFPLIGLFLAPIYPAINSMILSNLPKHRHSSLTPFIQKAYSFSSCGRYLVRTFSPSSSASNWTIREKYGGCERPIK